MDTASTSCISSAFRSSVTIVASVTSARVVGLGNTTDPFKGSTTDHTRENLGVFEVTVFTDVTTDRRVRSLISPVAIDIDTHDSFFSLGSGLHDNRISIPVGVSAVELSTTVERVAARPEGHTESSVLLTFRTFCPFPGVLHALSANPTVSSEFGGKEGVLGSSREGSEVTSNSEVISVQARTLSDKVRFVGLEEFVDMTSGRIVQGVGPSCPGNSAEITTLRS